MKKYTPILIALLLMGIPVFAQLIPFTSKQLAPTPTNGNCLTTNGSANSWSSSCGSGGSSGGTFSTTTSTVANQLINYPNNTSDIVVIGSNATTTGEFWFDPNSTTSYLSGKVGIGTTSPYASLSVVGQIVGAYFTATTTSINTFPYASTTGLTVSSGLTVGTILGKIDANQIQFQNSDGIKALLEIGSIASTDKTYSLQNKTGTLAMIDDNLGQFTNDLNDLTATNASLTFSGAYNGSTARTVGLNLGNTNTWSVLQNFNYSSSTIYSSFLNASSTNLFAGSFTLSTSSAGCASFSSTGQLFSLGSACGSGSGGLSSYDAWTHLYFGGANVPSYSATTSQMAIGTSTAYSYQLTVASSTAPQLALSERAGVAQWTMRNNGGNLSISTTTIAGTATTSIDALRLVGNGKPSISIGSSTPFATLSVVAENSTNFLNLFALATSSDGSTKSVVVDNNGILYLYNYGTCNGSTNALGTTAGQVTCDSLVSDQRKKKDILPLIDGLSTILSLKPVTFYWKDLTDHNTSDPRIQSGFIAQDVEKVLPSAVNNSPDGYLTLDKTMFISPLVKAVQQQNKKINWLYVLVGLLVLWNIILTIKIKKWTQ